jgi:hypothetical protein
MSDAAEPRSFAPLATAVADRYRIERELGQGGMATVYLAHDIKHDRNVALKVLSPDLAATLGHDRFLREITNTANLRHPHILPLFDSGEAGTFLYYVMPYVEGETLRSRLDREKQLPLDESLRITTEVAEALRYAHARGLVHRDIKPENILIDDGHAVVADFGIARAISTAGGQSLTQTGLAIGTPAYMSPEQAGGEADIDGRSDQYALACLTYEMLAGQPPFTGPTVASVVHQHLSAEPRRVTQLRSAVPSAVSDALHRALSKNPGDRFATSTAFATALRAEDRPKAMRVSRRVTLALIAVLAVAAAGVVWRSVGRDSTSALDSNVIAVLPFRVGGDPSIAYLRESMLDLLQARLMSAAGPRTVEPRTLLAAWRRSVRAETEDLSGDASGRLARTLGAGRMLLGSAIATPTALTLTGSLSRVADGRELARESVSGPADSIAVLVDRLTAALLIGEAGVARRQGTGIASAPLDALQDYLAGRKASRRGDYFGAMTLFGRAFARDSMFAEAAFAMVSTNAWIGTVFTSEGFAVAPRVWRLRDRLSPRDLDLFLAIPIVGPNYPRPSTNAEIIVQAERAASGAVDGPEQWVLLGQVLSHYGAAASRSDWAARSAAALDRAIALDSSFTLAITERLFTALEVHDRDAIARFSALLEARVGAGFSDDFFLWAAAQALGDSAAAIKWRDRKDGLSRTDYMQKLVRIALHSAALALPLDDARWAGRSLEREATTAPEQVGLSLSNLAIGFAEGRSTIPDASFGEAFGPQWVGTLLQSALIDPVYRPAATATLAQEAAGGYRLVLSGTRLRWPPVQDCFGTLLRLGGRDTTGAVAAIRRLHAFAASDHPPISSDEWQLIDFRVCELLLQALVEGTPAVGERRPSLDRLDSLMRDGPRGFAGAANFAPTAFANFAIARLREAQGDLPRALAAIRRRDVDYFPAYTWSLAPFLRQEGRLAALAGDAAGALRAYDGYLSLRTAPDPPLRPQRDSVITERAAVVAKVRR